MPSSARMRPQLGSSPWIAHFTRLARDTERAAATASSSLAAFSTSMRISLLAPSASATSCRARSAHTAVTAWSRSSYAGCRTGRAAREQQHGVVRRRAAVAVDAIEGDARGRAQHGVERGGVGHGVGRDHDEHRGQRRGEHARALRHPADDEAVAAGRRELRHRVGRHDRACSVRPAVGRGAGEGARQPVEEPVGGQTLADETGGAHRDVACADAGEPADQLGRAVRVEEAVRAGARVGAAGVERDRAHDAGAAAPAATTATGAAFTRLRVNTPAAACSGPSLSTRATSRSPEDFSPAATPAARKPCGGGDAHGATPISVSPAPSGRPRARLAFCSAWPAAPLTRLSIAETTTARPAVRVGSDLQVHGVGAERRPGLRPRPRRQDGDEPLVGVRRMQHLVQHARS